jgi:hypothetical protein
LTIIRDLNWEWAGAKCGDSSSLPFANLRVRVRMKTVESSATYFRDRTLERFVDDVRGGLVE